MKPAAYFAFAAFGLIVVLFSLGCATGDGCGVDWIWHLATAGKH